MRRAALVLLALTLPGCGALIEREAPAPAPQAKRRPGAYYKDDGPGDRPPADLASIADAVPRAEPLHRFANRPYQAFGREYVPLASAAGFRERGLASWYGRRYHGQKTASGEVYDMYAMTAAHPVLPIPSYARVTNPANGRSVVVRVNDRGPFHGERIIDLSYAAAWKLGFVEQGSAARSPRARARRHSARGLRSISAGSPRRRASSPPVVCTACSLDPTARASTRARSPSASNRN